LRWYDAPPEYGPHKTLYNRWKRWSGKGVFRRMFEALASADVDANDTPMIDATHPRPTPRHRARGSESGRVDATSGACLSDAIFTEKRTNGPGFGIGER